MANVRTTGKEDGEDTQISSSLALGDHGLLDNLVGNKVGSRSGTVTEHGGTSSTEDGSKTTLLVKSANNIDRSIVELGSTGALGLHIKKRSKVRISLFQTNWSRNPARDVVS